MGSNNLRFCLDDPKLVYFGKFSPSDESKKFVQIVDLVQKATVNGSLGILLPDT